MTFHSKLIQEFSTHQDSYVPAVDEVENAAVSVSADDAEDVSVHVSGDAAVCVDVGVGVAVDAVDVGRAHIA